MDVYKFIAVTVLLLVETHFADLKTVEIKYGTKKIFIPAQRTVHVTGIKDLADLELPIPNLAAVMSRLQRTPPRAQPARSLHSDRKHSHDHPPHVRYHYRNGSEIQGHNLQAHQSGSHEHYIEQNPNAAINESQSLKLLSSEEKPVQSDYSLKSTSSQLPIKISNNNTENATPLTLTESEISEYHVPMDSSTHRNTEDAQISSSYIDIDIFHKGTLKARSNTTSPVKDTTTESPKTLLATVQYANTSSALVAMATDRLRQDIVTDAPKELSSTSSLRIESPQQYTTQDKFEQNTQRVSQELKTLPPSDIPADITRQDIFTDSPKTLSSTTIYLPTKSPELSTKLDEFAKSTQKVFQELNSDTPKNTLEQDIMNYIIMTLSSTKNTSPTESPQLDTKFVENTVPPSNILTDTQGQDILTNTPMTLSSTTYYAQTESPQLYTKLEEYAESVSQEVKTLLSSDIPMDILEQEILTDAPRLLSSKTYESPTESAQLYAKIERNTVPPSVIATNTLREDMLTDTSRALSSTTNNSQTESPQLYTELDTLPPSAIPSITLEPEVSTYAPMSLSSKTSYSRAESPQLYAKLNENKLHPSYIPEDNLRQDILTDGLMLLSSTTNNSPTESIHINNKLDESVAQQLNNRSSHQETLHQNRKYILPKLNLSPFGSSNTKNSKVASSAVRVNSVFSNTGGKTSLEQTTEDAPSLNTTTNAQVTLSRERGKVVPITTHAPETSLQLRNSSIDENKGKKRKKIRTGGPRRKCRRRSNASKRTT